MNLGNWLEIGMAIWALIVIPRAIWRAWTRPAQEDPMPTIDLAERRRPPSWSLRGELARLFLVYDEPPAMSSRCDWPAPIEAGDRQVQHLVSEPVSVSVEPNTEDTEPVSGVTGASHVDASARNIIRASVVAELLDSGLLTNRDKAICQVFRCSKASSSRPEAPFQVALKLVEQHRAKARPELVGEMIERVQREVAAER